MEEKMNKLPKGWVWTRLGEISDIGAGNPAPQGEEYFDNGSFPFVRVQDMGNLRGIVYLKDTNDHINSKAIVKMKLFPKGSVLFTKSGMSILLNQRAILARDMYVVSHIGVSLPLGEIPSEWIFYWLKTIDFKNLTHATTLPSLQLSKVHEISVPISPLIEQNRIVAKIEELFIRLDAGVEALKKVKAQLKRYRQAVLKWAFEGKLTQEWREAHKGEIEPASALLERIKEQRKKDVEGKHKELLPSETSGLPGLPEGWVWTRLELDSDLITKGESPNWQGFNYVDNGIPFVRSENVLWGSIDLSHVAKIPEEFHKKLKRSQLKPNDVLINLVGASIGRCGIFSSDGEANINQAVALVRVNEALIPSYLMNLLLSPRMQKEIQESKVETARPNISLKDLRLFTIPLPSPSEQQKIVEEIENRLSIADNMEKVAEQSLKQSERLRQSILKRAFEGGLVPQDPTDEPAEKLLDRIKEEKVKREAENKRGKKQKSKNTKQMELI